MIDEDEYEESAESESNIAYIDKATLAKLVKVYQQNSLGQKINYPYKESYNPHLNYKSKSIPL